MYNFFVQVSIERNLFGALSELQRVFPTQYGVDKVGQISVRIMSIGLERSYRTA